jgi:4-amino-4-deoxy-L-arabinose transferase-like glycosyltransferase
MTRAGRRTLLFILLAAVAARLAFVVLFGHTLSLQASGYDVYAVNLLAGNGYTRFPDLHPDSDLPPLYAFFLAGVYTVFGRSPIPVALTQIGLDLITLLGVFAIGRRIGGERVGLLATAITGFYPYLLFQNVSVNDTAIFITLLVVGIWCAYRVHETGAPVWAVGVGAIFGVAALTKTLVLLVIPWLLLWWWHHLGWRRTIMLSVGLGLAFGLVVSPWVVRNTRLHGAFTLISTNDGSNLHQGNNACVADYLWRGWDAQWANCLAPTPAGLSELAESAWHRDQALAYLRDHPGEWPRLFGVKFLVMWSPELMPREVPPGAYLIDEAVFQYETPAFQVARVVHVLYFTPLLILGLVGMWLTVRERRPVAPILAVLLAITITYVIFHPSTRYRLPADPFLFVLAAYAVHRLWQSWRRRQRRELV